MLQFDHLAIGASTLEEGVAFAEQALGVAMGPGGAHPRMATHNRLLLAGPGRYIEVIAPDPAGTPPGVPRWFGLDNPPSPPRIVSWVARGTPAMMPEPLGEPALMSRGSLSWTITFPRDGSLPLGGALPCLIEWPEGVHPTQTMAESGVVLEKLIITAPEMGRAKAALAVMEFADMALLEFRRGPAALNARFSTPKGVVEI
jgi:hypothetical protein